MTLPQNVKDAARSIDDSETVAATPHPDYNALVKIISVDDWQIISAHLLSQAAELKILRVKCSGTLANNLCPDHRDKQVGNPCPACTIDKLQSRLAAANAQLRLMHRVLSQAVCVACADDGSAKDHELDKLEGVLRDQGWITTAVVPSTPTGAHLSENTHG